METGQTAEFQPAIPAPVADTEEELYIPNLREVNPRVELKETHVWSVSSPKK